MKLHAWLGVALVAVVVAAAVLYASGLVRPAVPASDLSVHPFRQVTVNGKALRLEVVSSPADEEEGLSDRASMPMDQGMLFDFVQPAKYSFWMQRMHFPLDIVWLLDGKVVDIAYDLPAPTSTLGIPAVHTPTVEADQVLELNAGQAQAYGMRMGSQVPTN